MEEEAAADADADDCDGGEGGSVVTSVDGRRRNWSSNGGAEAGAEAWWALEFFPLGTINVKLAVRTSPYLERHVELSHLLIITSCFYLLLLFIYLF